MLVVTNFQCKRIEKTLKMIETLSDGYSSQSTQRELSNEYQDDRVNLVFKKICFLVLWMKLALALEGLTLDLCGYGAVQGLHSICNHTFFG